MTGKWQHWYFVAYSYENGFGNFAVACDQMISRMEEITELAKLVEQSTGFNGVVVLNYQLLRSDWMGKGGIENVN